MGVYLECSGLVSKQKVPVSFFSVWLVIIVCVVMLPVGVPEQCNLLDVFAPPYVRCAVGDGS